MFKTIVWATDGSELADRALPIVVGLARSHRSKIVAVHADPVHAGRFGGSAVFSEEPAVVAKLERQVEDLRRGGFVAELRVVRGVESVPALISRAADEAEAGLIVVGTHGHGGVAAAVLGSVARGLLHAARCPVLSIPPLRQAVSRAQEDAA